MKKISSIPAILYAFLFFMLCCSKTQYGIITAKSGLILRLNPTVNSNRIDSMPKGTKVIILSTDGPQESLYKITANWYHISYNNKEGWAYGGFIRLLKTDLVNAYMAEAESFIEFYEYKNKSFDMTVNLCQGVGIISGRIAYEDDYIKCRVKKIDFSGFLGDDISEFGFKILGPERIMYKGSVIGCGPYNDLVLFKFDKYDPVY